MRVASVLIRLEELGDVSTGINGHGAWEVERKKTTSSPDEKVASKNLALGLSLPEAALAATTHTPGCALHAQKSQMRQVAMDYGTCW